MKKIVFNAPFNSLSFGNVSFNIARELHRSGRDCVIFPIGDKVDLSAFNNLNPDFHKWLNANVNRRLSDITQDAVTLQMWHLNGSETRFTPKKVLYTFYELDQPTLAEQNLSKLQDATIFSSSYARTTFINRGVTNTHSVPLGLDEDFYITGKEYMTDKIHFGLMGKFEKRKHTGEILRAWVKKYGNNFKYQLTCCITNPFFPPQQMESIINNILEGKRYGNVNFLPRLNTNSEVNDFINAIDIDLSGLSGAEGWNLPAFNATALGKWSIVLNATSHQDWATSKNSLQVEPEGKINCYDGAFFHEGAPFNQGTIYTFNTDVVISKMEEAEQICKTPNTEGLKLATNLTYEKTVNNILQICDSV